MKAAYIESTGSPDVIRYGDLPTPTPKAGEALIRIGAAALNPIDLYVRAGTVPMPLTFPFIPGSDLAGTVEAVGPPHPGVSPSRGDARVRGATRFKAGDRVWASNQGLLGRQGVLAEYAAVHEDWLHPTPAGVSDVQAAAAALVGITAHLGLFECAKLKPKEIAFVNGGTGGVGAMVVQMAKAIGAEVVTTVGSAEKAELCRTWGADAVFNYKTQDVDAGIRQYTQGKGVNVWYESQREPDFVRMVELMAPRGRIVVMAGRQARPVFPVGPFYVKGLSLHGFAMFNISAQEQRSCAEGINRWLAEGKLRPPIGRTFSLAEAAAAHRLLEENTLQKAGTLVGKVMVVP
ncbi:MAG TPA: NADPH:quinone reductase [Gemmataceae bacterium]|nr:NADPH:quinone reductase [Gemmataceae bacterium]